MSVPRRVTVIALCYNHAPYVLECLESIRAQTFQEFQLIITDDCSIDGSAQLIAEWLQRTRTAAIFLRHERNLGLCRTLNEAWALAEGDFISMIATDDLWEPDKIARQVAVADDHDEKVAVVYSDATRIDSVGHPLEGCFIEHAYPGCAPPSGRIFAILAERNFIPAMATLVRRTAVLGVGGYDERLTFEDYDMWLKLAARWQFVFCDGTVARYRLVSTSMVRTLFRSPSAAHYYTWYLIRHRWLQSRLLTAPQRRAWAQELFGAAYGLYVLGDRRASRCLCTAAVRTLSFRALLLAVASTLGITRLRAKRFAAFSRLTSAE